MSEDEECLKCSGAPFDCTCCSRMCELYGYDEETGKLFIRICICQITEKE